MKKTIMLFIVIASLISCKKETVTPIIDDFRLNREIDQRISDGILTFSSSERDAIFAEKEVILIRIIRNNPNIKFEDLYPKKVNEQIYLSKEICVSNYTGAMTNCRVAMAVNCLVAVLSGVGSGLGASVPTTPIGGIVVGVGVGTAGLSAAGLAYYMCSVNAADAYKYCQSQP